VLEYLQAWCASVGLDMPERLILQYPHDVALVIGVPRQDGPRLPIRPVSDPDVETVHDAPTVRRVPPPTLTVGPGCRCVRWGERLFSFTEPQARAFALLHSAWASGAPDVDDAALLTAAGGESTRLSDVFRRCDAWGSLIAEGGTRGTHRLAPNVA
jgi:hypothetical protein